MPPSTIRTRVGVAPTPPAGPTTQASLAAMAVGVILAVLLLFDVVPTPEKVQAIGVIVSALFALVPYVVMAISRTKQANNLAKLAQGERIAERAQHPPRLVAGTSISAGYTVRATLPTEGEIKVWSGPREVHGAGRRLGDHVGETTPRTTLDPSYRAMPADVEQALHEIGAWTPSTDEPTPLGLPVDPTLEVPNGSIRPPGVEPGGEAPEAGVTTAEAEATKRIEAMKP